MLRWAAVAAFIAVWSLVLYQAESCNEAVCASVVSKCMLTKSCNCELKNCSCCKECFACLNYLYKECCSCVGMCPKPNDTNAQNALSKQSHVEEIPVPVPSLFSALMSGEPDTLQRWVAITFPIDFDMSAYRHKHEKEIKVHSIGAEQDVSPRKDIITLNCTVAYMRQCLGLNKCKKSCESTGASSYRWFHDGCCECVGDSCINYGINESRCPECPVPKEDPLPEDESLYTYEYTEDVGMEEGGEKPAEDPDATKAL